MSNEEKEKRERYIKLRRKRIKFQVIILFIISVLSILSFAVYNNLNKTFYISYVEHGEVDYKVYLKDNDFYEEDYLGKDQAYVASLIDDIEVDFMYKLNMETEDIEFKYSYYVTAKLEIIDKTSNEALFNPVYPIKNEETFTQNSNNDLIINEKVIVDYEQYNNIANSFINSYNLSDTTSTLILTTHINVISVCKEFDSPAHNEYEVSLLVPLTTKTINIEMTTSVPQEENKILACDIGVDKNIFKFITIFLLAIDVLLVFILLAFIQLTKNFDIDYNNKVQKIIKNYKSYIQKLTNHFNLKGYQVLQIESFNELLEIRDTIQSPILMDENNDKTLTNFIIPSSTSILYVYTIKVENYDEIYGTEEVVEETVEEVVPENSEPEVVPEVVEEAVESTPDTPDTPSENEEIEVEEIVINDDEEDEESGIPGIIYNYSFEAKLSLSDYQTKTYYESIIRFIKSYGVKIIRSWKKERIYLGRKQFAVLSFRGKRLSVSLALDPKDYIDSKYRFTDVSEIKKYINTPMMMKLTSDRKLKHTLELLGVIFKKAELEQNVQNVSFKKVAYQSKNSLIKKGLIKVKEKQPV